MKFVSEYISRVKSLPFFRHNDFKANLIFVLIILLYFVLAEDLVTEMAKSKDEIGSFLAICEESRHSLTVIESVVFKLVILSKVYALSCPILIPKFIFCNQSGRSPPDKSFQI